MIRPSIAVLRFGDVVFEVWALDHCRTVFPDGTTLPASPSADVDGQAAVAADLGYREDVARMVVEHELAHCLLAAWRGLPESPALSRAARGEPPEPADLDEEALVLAFQRLANTGDIRPALEPFSPLLPRWLVEWRNAIDQLWPKANTFENG